MRPETKQKQASNSNGLFLFANREVGLVFERRQRGELEQNRWEVIRTFFTANGKLIYLPAKHKKKLMVLEYLVKDLKVGVKYPENELNEYIKKFHDDYATIRRELIINHFMYRENGIYELNPPDMWRTF
jgi:hypothetical protein